MSMVTIEQAFEAWAKTQEPILPPSIGIMLSERILMRLTVEMAKIVAGQMIDVLAREAVERGLTPTELRLIGNSPAPDLEEWRVYIEGPCKPTLLNYISRLNQQADRNKELLALPWWKLAWWKLAWWVIKLRRKIDG